MNDFTFVDNWFYNKYFLKLETGHRFWTMHTAMSLFLQRNGKTIVETGCVRLDGDWGAGMSTVIFADIASRYDKDFITIDISGENLDISKDLIHKYIERIPPVLYLCMDSVRGLTSISKKIDFLYLDSLDYDFKNPLPAQEHCLKELQAAYPKLSEKAVVLIDDNLLPGGGKPAKAKRFLEENGWRCILDHHQTLWTKM